MYCVTKNIRVPWKLREQHLLAVPGGTSGLGVPGGKPP